MQAIFLNKNRVGELACYSAVNLIVVEIPEDITNIGRWAFKYCTNLSSILLPSTLISIGKSAFEGCSSLDNVELSHTNLHEIRECAFHGCSELKSVTIPDSLQKPPIHVFCSCSKLVPSDIGIKDNHTVVVYLRSKQQS
ncbi:hypothetical protein TL16_g02495 [Triparma laevis f. inornata]|uniref:Leucine-rich repeat domain-containing protein n=1 Tax=Triparma laevis f. inornata TaxID=1714386 RepID=A0A9W6ZVJ2_9STRA|nr:hypothetical protein TL16_g02495 [Triparma laevis f. inornata]